MMKNPIDTIRDMTKGLDLPLDKEASHLLTSAYYDLTIDEGRDLAADAVKLDDRYTCSVILLNLALLIPGSLADIHSRLLALIDRIWEWPAVFFQADSTISEELSVQIAHENDVQKKYKLVEALAWTGNKSSQKILSGLAEEKLYFASDNIVEIKDVIPTAGWELTTDGGRRDLFFIDSYELELGDEENKDQLLSRCPSCNRQLYTPFQFRLSDPRLKFLEMEGEEICIGTCFNCVQYVPIFMNIDTNGQSLWNSNNKQPKNKKYFDYMFEVEKVLIENKMSIGDKVRSPYESAAWLPHNPNHLGGFPGWVQWPDYPICSSCHKRMKFLAQFDIYGVYYAFICSDCLIAATTAQFD